MRCSSRHTYSGYARGTIVAAGIAVLAGFGSGAALGQDVQTPSQANPNNITYQESQACLSRVLRNSQVLSIRPSIPPIRRGTGGTRGPITLTSRVSLDNLCVINSPSVTSRLHPAGERSVASTVRIKRRGAGKYGDWLLIDPSAVGPQVSDALPGSATHKVNLVTSDDGLTSTGAITSRFRLPAHVSRLRTGDRVQSGVFVRFNGLILYDTGRVDPLSPGVPVTVQVGGSRVIAGTSVAVRSQSRAA